MDPVRSANGLGLGNYLMAFPIKEHIVAAFAGGCIPALAPFILAMTSPGAALPHFDAAVFFGVAVLGAVGVVITWVYDEKARLKAFYLGVSGPYIIVSLVQKFNPAAIGHQTADRHTTSARPFDLLPSARADVFGQGPAAGPQIIPPLNGPDYDVVPVAPNAIEYSKGRFAILSFPEGNAFDYELTLQDAAGRTLLKQVKSAKVVLVPVADLATKIAVNGVDGKNISATSDGVVIDPAPRSIVVCALASKQSAYWGFAQAFGVPPKIVSNVTIATVAKATLASHASGVLWLAKGAPSVRQHETIKISAPAVVWSGGTNGSSVDVPGLGNPLGGVLPTDVIEARSLVDGALHVAIDCNAYKPPPPLFIF